MKMLIKDIRKARGVSQSELAALTGLRNATISEVESGHGNPRLETLTAIAAALGVGVRDLFPQAPDDECTSEIAMLLACSSEETRDAVRVLLKHQTIIAGKDTAL